MKHYLSTKYEKVISTKDFVVAVGDAPIGLVAHLDTVFNNSPQEIFYDRVKNVMWSPNGLGADDRAGVYAIVQIIKAGFRPTVIFTTNEELGCLGAEKLIEYFPEPPKPLKYIVQLDRKGSNDCVFYSCNNPKFDDYIESFGFITNFGTYSDISVICPKWGIAGVNLSIGYYNEHSMSEILRIGQMFDTIEKVKKMLQNFGQIEYFKYIENPNYTKWFSGKINSLSDEELGWDPSYGISKEDWKAFMEPQSKCSYCKKWDFDYNLFPTKDEDGSTVFFCSDCITQKNDIHWCAMCGEPFIDHSLSDKNNLTYCKDCRGKINAKKSKN